MNFIYILLLACLVRPTINKNGKFKNQETYFDFERTTMVHMFEWKWDDIAQECELFLGPKGYGGVQVSPPNENLQIFERNRPWWERYHPVSYDLITRSGNESQFADMVRRCNDAGVRVYVDAVINHMAGEWASHVGTGGGIVYFNDSFFANVPYSVQDFHWPECVVSEYDHKCCPSQMRNCNLDGRKDLNQRVEYVRITIVKYMNRLIGLGVAGFRIDSALYMWPSELKNIYDQLDNLNVSHRFPTGAKPYIYQEVEDLGGQFMKINEYTSIGAVTEFKFGLALSRAFNGLNQLSFLRYFSNSSGVLKSRDAVTFIDNHKIQRELEIGSHTLTYKQPKKYKAAVAFMLAYPYGLPRLMSSYEFNDYDAGPATNKGGDVISPTIKSNFSGCGEHWICEHRWPQIYGMVTFRNVAAKTKVTHWWDNGGNQIAFCRQSKGFIAFNNELEDLDEHFQTDLEPGEYCDIMSGENIEDKCTGKKVVVHEDGKARIKISANDDNMMLAIHVGIKSKISPPLTNPMNM